MFNLRCVPHIRIMIIIAISSPALLWNNNSCGGYREVTPKKAPGKPQPAPKPKATPKQLAVPAKAAKAAKEVKLGCSKCRYALRGCAQCKRRAGVC